MPYRGHVHNGLVVIDDTMPLPEGTEVTVEPATASRIPTLAEQMGDLIGAIKDLPEDMAEHHDHYIHGTPKP